MISFGRDVRVFVATQPINFRKGVHGLVALVAEGLVGEPYSGDVFVFRSKRSDRLKLLVFDGTGLVLATKWLEDGDFAWPPVSRGDDARDGGELGDADRRSLGVVASGPEGDEAAEEYLLNRLIPASMPAAMLAGRLTPASIRMPLIMGQIASSAAWIWRAAGAPYPWLLLARWS